MKILLFDDDKSTVDMLLSTIDWASLGFDDFAAVYSVAQAKNDFIENGPADVMVCDIEAPGGTGLDLLRWVRENGYSTENIFLTNYDSFAFASEAIKLDCVEYILKMSPISDVEKAVRRAINRVSVKNRLQAFEEKAEQESNAAPPRINELPEFPEEGWMALLREGEKGPLFKSIQTYLNKLDAAGCADRIGLLRFSHAYLHMLVSVLEQNGIAANVIFGDGAAVRLFSVALDSPFHMLQWADYSLSATVRELAEAGGSAPVIEQIRSYLDSHYTERISRSELASRFFLSQDYLSHAFSSRYGVTIPEYINRKRIGKARDELDRGKNVTEAASEAGFDNLSYFSTLFKKITGESPSDYIRSVKK
ncbi:MAG: helix-turn-helix domain-containing protein [Oscillospiraceae bacterium]|nr:helix-turn-helix domain-containing protein [Oscillospiraceae bacterium]